MDFTNSFDELWEGKSVFDSSASQRWVQHISDGQTGFDSLFAVGGWCMGMGLAKHQLPVPQQHSVFALLWFALIVFLCGSPSLIACSASGISCCVLLGSTFI